MKILAKSVIATVGVILLFTGCATTQSIPMTSDINDFVMMKTETHTERPVAFEFKSNVSDGIIYPCGKDKGPQNTHISYQHTECATLERMLRDFMSMRYANVSPDADTRITVTLTDFWIEQYSTTSTGKAVWVAFAGGEISSVLVARVRVLLTVSTEEGESSKAIFGSSEDNFVSGIGTGTKTSYIHRGKDSAEFVHAKNINKANNKVLMMIDSYLEQKGL